jgi:hypothetical protein
MMNIRIIITIIFIYTGFSNIDQANGNNKFSVKDEFQKNTSVRSEKENWNSSILYKGEDGALIYHSDENGNRIPDFSHAGYHGGGVSLPEIPVIITLDPSDTGDDTQQIQQALDDVGALEPDENGHRGAVLLNPGNYHISSRIIINQSGVVLRGSGDETDPSQNTIISAAKTIGDVSIQVGNGDINWSYSAGSPISEIVTEFVAVGNRHFEVADASNFSVGDEIVIFHRATQEWIEAVEYGGTAPTHPDVWKPGDSSLNIVMKRKITGITGNVMAVDVPIYNHLNRNLSESLAYKVNLDAQISEAGVEHFRLVLESDGPLAINHGISAIVFDGVTNSWADNVTVLHFQYTGLGVTNSTFVTIQNSRALEPHSLITGGYRYNFNAMARANNILFTNLLASEGRHEYVSNGTASVSGVVFHKSATESSYGISEGHRRWSMALLYDQIIYNNPNNPGGGSIGLYNRGEAGTNHGWSSAHSVAWNSDTGPVNKIIIQQPPTAQNYGIANQGIVTGDGPWPGDAGFIEGTGEIPEFPSLYEAQYHDRVTYGIPPDAPAKLTLTPVGQDQIVYLNLEWIHHDLDTVELVIERSVNNGPYEELIRLNSTETSYVDQNVSTDLYTYRMVAIDNGRMSAWSNIAGFDMQRPTFDLRSPSSGNIVEISDDDQKTLNMWWTSITSDFDFTFTWYLDHADGDFSDPLLAVETDVNLVQIPYTDLKQVLNDAGINVDDTLNGIWTVKAGAGALDIWADEPFGIQMINGILNTNILQEMTETPERLYLYQNFPNPAKQKTVISFSINQASNIELSVYSILGHEIERINKGILNPGDHEITLDTSDYSSGIYIYRISSDNYSKTQMMNIVK